MVRSPPYAPLAIAEEADADGQIVKLLEPLTCCICLQIAVFPIRPPHSVSAVDCGLVLCSACGSEWQRSERARGAQLVCPRCRAPITGVPLHPHPLLRALVGPLRVRCGGCDTVDTAARMHAHCPQQVADLLRDGHETVVAGPFGDIRCRRRGPCLTTAACQWDDTIAFQLGHCPGPAIVDYFRECLPAIVHDTRRMTRLTQVARPVVLPMWIHCAENDPSDTEELLEQLSVVEGRDPSVAASLWRFLRPRWECEASPPPPSMEAGGGRTGSLRCPHPPDSHPFTKYVGAHLPGPGSDLHGTSLRSDPVRDGWTPS